MLLRLVGSIFAAIVSCHHPPAPLSTCCRLLDGGGKACQYFWWPGPSRDARLAQDGARLMTGPFRPPGEPPVFTPAAAAAPAALPLPLPRHRPLLPLLTSPPATTITAVCPGDVLACPDGLVVSREIVDGGCNFAPCPDRAYPVGTAGSVLSVLAALGNSTSFHVYS